MSAECCHEEFQAEVDVHRLTDSGTFRADVRVHCKRCGEPFRFLGAPPGIMQPHPCVNADGTELSVGIEPEGQKRFYTTIPIYLPKLPEKA